MSGLEVWIIWLLSALSFRVFVLFEVLFGRHKCCRCFILMEDELLFGGGLEIETILPDLFQEILLQWYPNLVAYIPTREAIRIIHPRKLT